MLLSTMSVKKVKVTTMPSIPELNLEKMISMERDGMQGVLLVEAIGGNASNFGKFLCAVANFRYDGETGLIDKFGNAPFLDDPHQLRFHYGTFRVAYSSKRKKFSFFTVASIHLDKWLGVSSEEARKNLLESTRLYRLSTVE